jgi:rusticyanin
MMSRDGGTGSMMGGSMMGRSGYTWMMGGSAAPAWMHGGTLPGPMMGTSADPGQIMGRLFADAPGPRVSAADAARLGHEMPAGANVDRGANRVTFDTSHVRIDLIASPPGAPDETFEVAGLVNPTITVPRGASVTIEFVNADPDTAHGVVVTSPGAAQTVMPMMTSSPSFSGSVLWFLGEPSSAGLHVGTLRFTAATPGTYEYLCPVPGHAQKGMVGSFDVSS